MSKAVGLNPENFLEGGGLIDDVDVTFTECLFEEFDYNGKADTAVPALKVVMDVAGDENIQYYSMGRLQDWIPSEDGKQLLSVGTATSIRLSSNGGILLKSLVDSGFPGDKLGDDISILNGLQVHMIQVPEPQRGMKKTKEQEEKETKFGPKTILVVSEVQVLPWEKKKPAGAGAKKKPAGKAKPKAAKAAAAEEVEGGEIEEKATEVIMEILADAGTATKKELPAKIFQLRKDDPDRNAIVKVVFDDDFLSNGPWEYDDGILVSG